MGPPEKRRIERKYGQQTLVCHRRGGEPGVVVEPQVSAQMKNRIIHFLSPFRHRSEQYFTSSHTRSHFFRHANGRPHAAQIFVGRWGFLCMAKNRQPAGGRRLRDCPLAVYAT